MGFFDSKVKKTTTNTYETKDQRTTNTINAGVGGDIKDSLVFSGVDGAVNYTSNSIDGGAFKTVDRAIDMVGDSATELIKANSQTAGELFGLTKYIAGFLGERQDEVLNAAENLAANSLNLASTIAVGESVAKTTDRNTREYVRLGVIGIGIVAGVGGLAYVGGKFAGGK